MASHPKRAFLLGLSILYGLLLLLHFNIDYAEFGGDDLIYRAQSSQMDFADWTAHWYNNWNGRISFHSAMYLVQKAGIPFWRLINPLFMLLLAYAAARVAFGPLVKKQPGPYFAAAFALLALLSTWMLIMSSFWMTGSINYLWVTALGLVAVLPYTDSAFHRQPFRLAWYSIAAGLYAVLGQEQAAMVVLVIMASAVVILYRRRQMNWKMLLGPGLMAGCFLIVLAAPGNAVRMASESNLWFPGFLDFSILTKIAIGLEFMFQGILTSNSLLVVLFLGCLIYGLQRAGRSKILTAWITAGLVFACLLIINSGGKSEHISEIFINFDHLIQYDRDAGTAYNLINIDFLHSVSSMAFWGVMLFVLAPLAMGIIYGKDQTGLLMNLVFYACAVLSLIMMAFSPTMYESGPRVLYVFAVCLVILILRLLAQALPGGLLVQTPVQIFNVMIAIVFLAPYALIFNDYALSAPVSMVGGASLPTQVQCGADLVELESRYVLHIKGWIAAPGAVGPAGKQVILVQGLSRADRRAFLAVKKVQPPDRAIAEMKGTPLSGFEGRVNFVEFPPDRYRIGLGALDSQGQLSGVCAIDQILVVGDGQITAIEE